MSKIQLYMPPADYTHPKQDRVWSVGDRVEDLYSFKEGHGIVVSVSDYYINRASKRIDRPQYTIDWDRGGTSVRFGYELNISYAPMLPPPKWTRFKADYTSEFALIAMLEFGIRPIPADLRVIPYAKTTKAMIFRLMRGKTQLLQMSMAVNWNHEVSLTRTLYTLTDEAVKRGFLVRAATNV